VWSSTVITLNGTNLRHHRRLRLDAEKTDESCDGVLAAVAYFLPVPVSVPAAVSCGACVRNTSTVAQRPAFVYVRRVSGITARMQQEV